MNWVKQFLAPPIFEDEEKTRVASVLNIILLSILAILMTSAIGALFIFPDLEVALLVTGAMSLLVLGALFLMRRGRVQLASILFLSGLWMAYTPLIYLSGGMTSFLTIGYMAVVIAVGLLLGGLVAMAYAGLSIVAGLGMLYVESIGLLPPPAFPLTASSGWLALTANLFVAVAVLNLASRSLNDALERVRRSNRELQAIHGSLEERVTERTRELRESTSELAFRSQELEAANLKLEEARRRQEAINRELQTASEHTRRRAVQLQAVAEVGRAIAQVRDLERLLPQVTEFVSRHFDFYHVGIFLVDQAGRYAVLRAANSHRLLAIGS